MNLDEVHLDSERGAWLTVAEAQAHDEFTRVITGLIDFPDVAVLFGAGGGGIAACLRRCHPSHLILVEDDRDNRKLLDMSWKGVRGVALVDRDPVEAMPEILAQQQPSVAVLNIPERLTEPRVIRTLAQPNESLEILVIVYPMTPLEQHEGLDEMLRTWHTPELRWFVKDHDGPINIELYIRGEP